jgi:dipeptidyl aminopeptidase/acylaminoacyl peptidase
MRLRPIVALVVTWVAVASACTPKARVRFERVYPLKGAESVFAYARISPDGHVLAYASELANPQRPSDIQRTVTVVDLRTGAISFTEPGIDAYWSNDGQRLIFLSARDGRLNVSIRNQTTGAIARDVAPPWLGDYYSWGVRDGQDLILTIDSYYYFLNGDKAVMPARSVQACEGIGTCRQGSTQRPRSAVSGPMVGARGGRTSSSPA